MTNIRAKCICVDAISSSQVTKFLSCEKQWGYRYIQKLPEKQFAFQELGTQVHLALENYLIKGIHPTRRTKASQIAYKGLAYLPPPKQPHAVEEHLAFDVEDITFHGYPDLLPYNHCGVTDFKTTSNLMYAKNSEDLKSDPQALIYGYKQMIRYDHADGCDFKWIYFETKGACNIKVVESYLDRKELKERFFDIVVDAAKKMRHHKDSDTNPDVLLGNLNQCSAYGGCSFSNICLKSPLKEHDMSLTLKERMMQQAAKNAAGAGAEKISASVGDSITKEPTILEKLSAKSLGAKVFNVESPIRAVGINPPDAAPDFIGALTAERAVANPEFTAMVETAAKKRGRPAKIKAEEIETILDTATIGQEAVDNWKLTVYINCYPIKTQYQTKMLGDLLAEVTHNLDKDAGGPFRLADAAAYGKGDAILADAFNNTYKGLLKFGEIIVDVRDKDQAAVLPVLERWADVVVRALI